MFFMKVMRSKKFRTHFSFLFCEGNGVRSQHLTSSINETVVAEKEEFFAMVQLDLYGDTKVVLPYEPKFCKKEIATQMEKKHDQRGAIAYRGEMDSSRIKWQNPHCLSDIFNTL
jgi:hypothetical protein